MPDITLKLRRGCVRDHCFAARDQAAARSDLNRMVANGGCERTQADYVGLLEAADLQLAQVTPLPGKYSVMDAAPR